MNIKCLRCGEESPALEKQPYPGILGETVSKNTCQTCWALWQKFSVNVIKDYKLRPFLPKDRGILEQNMKKYLNLESQGLSQINLTGQGKTATFT
ncbi:MAG: Fe(2+)-trafficking protein [Deltaproteobacteria bacterium]|nr:MAG: Fe(2+)-trafficking protein [Deltaproteobacteria bacterium]